MYTEQPVDDEQEDVKDIQTDLENSDEVKDEIKEDVPEDSQELKKEEKEDDTDDEKEDMNESDEVQIVTETIEEIVIDDKTDTEETAEKSFPDCLDIEFSKVVIKQEPIDDDEMLDEKYGIKPEPIDDSKLFLDYYCFYFGECLMFVITDVVDIPVITSMVDNTQTEVVSSIDGNVQLESGVPITTSNSLGAKIKINITKPIANLPKEIPVPTNIIEPDPILPIEPPEDSNEPLPPGEEPIQLNLKPALQGVKLTRQPIVKKGTELTGMCSIM